MAAERYYTHKLPENISNLAPSHILVLSLYSADYYINCLQIEWDCCIHRSTLYGLSTC